MRTVSVSAHADKAFVLDIALVELSRPVTEAGCFDSAGTFSFPCSLFSLFEDATRNLSTQITRQGDAGAEARARHSKARQGEVRVWYSRAKAKQ